MDKLNPWMDCTIHPVTGFKLSGYQQIQIRRVNNRCAKVGPWNEKDWAENKEEYMKLR